MAIRIISAFVALPLFFVLIYLLPPVCLPFAISVISVVAVYELLWRSKVMNVISLMVISCVFAFFIPLAIYFQADAILLYSAFFLFVLLLFVTWLLKQKEIAFRDIALTFFAAIVIPLFFSSVTNIFSMSNGKLLVLMPFIAT